MADKEAKNILNVAGDWYCTDPEQNLDEGCIECGACYGAVPEIFGEDENGDAYVIRQPENEDEVALCQEQLEDCPVDSIGCNG